MPINPISVKVTHLPTGGQVISLMTYSASLGFPLCMQLWSASSSSTLKFKVDAWVKQRGVVGILCEIRGEEGGFRSLTTGWLKALPTHAEFFADLDLAHGSVNLQIVAISLIRTKLSTATLACDYFAFPSWMFGGGQKSRRESKAGRKKR